MVASHAAAVASSIYPEAALIYTMHGALGGGGGVLPTRVRGSTSQLDVSSLTPLSVAGCGRLQLVVPHLAATVEYCK